MEEEKFAGIILSSAQEHHARWFHHDLPHRLQHLGVPVMVIPPEPDSDAPLEDFPEQWRAHPVGGPGAY
jgi:hypothetical protein